MTFYGDQNVRFHGHQQGLQQAFDGARHQKFNMLIPDTGNNTSLWAMNMVKSFGQTESLIN